MIKQAQEHIKKFLSTFFHNTLVLVLSSLIGVPVLVSWATGTIDSLIQIIKAPVPLWATSALVLLCYLYIHSKNQKLYEKFENKCQSLISHTKEKLNFIFHNNLLWLPDDKAPFCPLCYEVKEKMIHMLSKEESNNYESWKYYECHTCNHRTDFSGHPLDVPF